MNITLFSEITTESALLELEANGKKYEDLYVDMNEKEQRKYVKDSAALINGMLKRLDRARIDISKEHKAQVEAEAKSIRERLQAANEPFAALIDLHNTERKSILDSEKAKQAAIDLARQIESDHEIGLLLNDKFDNEKDQREADREAAQKAHDEQVAAQAVEAERKRKEAEDLRIKREQEVRVANVENQRNVNRKAVSALLEHNCVDGEAQAQLVIKAIRNELIPGVNISY